MTEEAGCLLLVIGALQERGVHLAPGFPDGLAVFHGNDSRELFLPAQEIEQPAHGFLAIRQRRVAPAGERGLGSVHRTADVRNR